MQDSTAKSAADLRSRIMQAKPQVASDPVWIDEWGVSVWVRELSLGERDEFESAQIMAKDGGGSTINIVGLKERLVKMCLVDEHGKRIFEPTDDLSGLGAAGIEQAFVACQRVNRMTKADAEKVAANLPKARINGTGTV